MTFAPPDIVVVAYTVKGCLSEVANKLKRGCLPDMQFFTASILLLTTSLLGLGEADGFSTADSPGLGYSDVSALYADLQEKSALGQYREAAELGVKAESFLITRTIAGSSQRANY